MLYKISCQPNYEYKRHVLSSSFLRNLIRQQTQQIQQPRLYIYSATPSHDLTILVNRLTLKNIKTFIMQTTFIIASMAILGAMANPAPSPMGIEVIRRDGLTMVREVVSFSTWLNFSRRG